ncbi:hypothetical protein [Seleniivibrio woodruffii]|uniref:hypothetical protein n=1 Tax=Seleniivibrio woodruffii TaxID=1078050 RepID=UPI002409F6FD|nr:hypothetical protein [Seleniivibrio woodruffii]
MLLNDSNEDYDADITILQNGREITIVLAAVGKSTIWKMNNLMKMYDSTGTFLAYAVTYVTYDTSANGDPHTISELEKTSSHFGPNLNNYGAKLFYDWNDEFGAYAFEISRLPVGQYTIEFWNTTGARYDHFFTIV